MSIEVIIFYSLAVTLLVGALGVVTARNTVHSAMFLILVFFTTTALWITLRAEFLALVLILVYVGAVMVLFLFVLMMLNLNKQKVQEGFIKYLPLGIVIGVLVAAEMIIILTRGFGSYVAKVNSAADAEGYSNTAELGKILYTEYLFAFEAAAVLLLIAMIAAIVLTLYHVKGVKKQNPGQQVRVKKEDRLRIIKMDSEPKQAPGRGDS